MKDADKLANRIVSLGRRGRAMMVVAIAIIMTISVGAWMDSPESKVVRAAQIELVDGGGRVRAAIEMRNGAPAFSLRDSLGGERVLITTNSDETAIFVKDAEGTTRLGMAQFSHGGGGFAAHGPQSRGAAVLYLKDTGTLSFYDGDNELVSRFPDGD